MGKLARILPGVVVMAVLLFAAAVTFTVGWRPIIGPKLRPVISRKFEVTPQRLERGRYIFNSASGCVDCHSEHDLSQKDHPVLDDMRGAGEVMPFSNLPGLVVASNLTPDPQNGAGTWTDDELARAIREGIGHDGRTLFPLMPYEHYRHMADEDLASVVVYLRSLPPIHHELPKTEIVFPVKYLIRSAPEPVTASVSAPNPANQVQWGAY